MQTNEPKEQDGGMWLKNKWPNVRVLDHNWTMERYDYPQYVRVWIKNNWIKVNDKNGGTYAEPEYYKNTSKRLYKHIIPFKAEVDAFASKTEELATEYRNQK